MNPKDQLDNNELEQNHIEGGKDFSDTKDNEIISDLEALKKQTKINAIHENETLENDFEEITQIKNEIDAIKKEVLSSEENKKVKYIPGHVTDEHTTLELANAGRKTSVQNIKNNIQKYPGRLGGLIKSIDNLT